MCGEVGGRETAPPTEGEFPPTFAYLDPYDDTFIFVEIPPFEPAHIEFGAITSVNLVPKVTGEAGVSKSLVVKFFTKEGVIQVDMMKYVYQVLCLRPTINCSMF